MQIVDQPSRPASCRSPPIALKASLITWDFTYLDVRDRLLFQPRRSRRTCYFEFFFTQPSGKNDYRGICVSLYVKSVIYPPPPLPTIPKPKLCDATLNTPFFFSGSPATAPSLVLVVEMLCFTCLLMGYTGRWLTKRRINPFRSTESSTLTQQHSPGWRRKNKRD